MLRSFTVGRPSKNVLEKPFGRDLASARRLNAALHAVVDERHFYRIDHRSAPVAGSDRADGLQFVAVLVQPGLRSGRELRGRGHAAPPGDVRTPVSAVSTAWIPGPRG
jgi:hypothetical protein